MILQKYGIKRYKKSIYYFVDLELYYIFVSDSSQIKKINYFL